MTEQSLQLELSAPVEPRSSGCVVPLTVQQRRILHLLRDKDPDNKARNVRMCASATRIVGPLDVASLRTSIETVVWRHESLRTRFVTVGSVTTQHVDAAGDYELTMDDLSDLPQLEAEQAARRLSQDLQEQKIDLSAGPVFEARLFRLSPEQHVLILLIDHMVSDGISNALLYKEIWLGYDAAVSCHTALLPPLPVQFPDYAVWQERTHEAWRRDHEAYWRQHLSHAPDTRIPTCSELLQARPPVGMTRYFPFGTTLSERLRALAAREQTLLSVVGLTAYAVAMSHWCQQEDLVIRCPLHGRHGRPELANVIGFIVNVLHLRMEVRSTDTLQDLLDQAHQEMYRAFEHRDFDRVPDLLPECRTELEFHWRSARSPGRSSNPQRANRQIAKQPFFVRVPDWPWKFWSVFDHTPAGICMTVHFWPHLLASSAVEHFAGTLREVAEALVDRPRVRVGSIVRSSRQPAA